MQYKHFALIQAAFQTMLQHTRPFTSCNKCCNGQSACLALILDRVTVAASAMAASALHCASV